jgi:zinc/manganese transport system ATP-binding protein
MGGRGAMTAIGISVRDLTIAYDKHPAVHHLDGCFNPGSLTAVVGPNGAGKSSLLKAIIGVLKPVSGTIDRAGIRGRDVGYLPQSAEIDRAFPLSVADTLILGAWRRTGALRGVDAITANRARAALASVGLEGFERRRIAALSAGQFQRVLFARLLLQDAPVVVLDEPFAAIDASTTRDLLGLLHRWHGEGRTVIAALHDFDQVRAHFPDALLLARELIAWGPTDTVLSPANLSRAREMAERWDETAPVCEHVAGGAA